MAKPGDIEGRAVPPSRKLFFMLPGIGFSRFFWSYASVPGHLELPSRGPGAAVELMAKWAKPAKREVCAFH